MVHNCVFLNVLLVILNKPLACYHLYIIKVVILCGAWFLDGKTSTCYFQSAHLDQLRTTFIQAGSSGMTNVADYNPLHMMFCTDPAFCYIWKAKWEKYMASTKHEPTFISKGFTNCMERCYSPVETILQDVCILARKVFFLYFVRFCKNLVYIFLQDTCKILQNARENILQDS